MKGKFSRHPFACLLWTLFALINSANASASAEYKDWNGQHIAWLDYEAGLAQAKVSNKPALVIFHASWCSTCHHYKKLFKQDSVIAKTKRFVMILVDVDKRPDLSAQYGSEGQYTPRTFILKPDGKLMNALYQSHSKRRFKYFLPVESTQPLLQLMDRALKPLV